MTIVVGYPAMTPADLLVDVPVHVVARTVAGCCVGPEPIFIGQTTREDIADSGVWGAKLLDDESGLFQLFQDPSQLDASERVAANILRAIVGSAPSVESALVPAGDGGLTLEFISDATDRDLLFAIPSDGSVRYFTARGPDGFRRSGIVDNDIAFTQLARWLANQNSDFSSMGLDVG